MTKKLKHPDNCKNCDSDMVTYERFTPYTENGEYVCDECGWGIDAVTGKVMYKGEKA